MINKLPAFSFLQKIKWNKIDIQNNGSIEKYEKNSTILFKTVRMVSLCQMPYMMGLSWAPQLACT